MGSIDTEMNGGGVGKHVVLMCGYLPGATESRSPLNSPVVVRLPETDVFGECWEDVCGGGCGFAMAISDSGRLITWGSADDQGQSYLTSGKHGEIPEPFPLSVETPIVKAAAGWAHIGLVTDVGQVWGWGYGGEGQLGLGSRIKTVNSPHLIPCIEQCSTGEDRQNDSHQGSSTSTSQATKFLGSCIKSIACGGRHSAVITDAGLLLTFGWGSYGQCGHGNTNDVLSPSYVSSLLGKQINTVAAGLWHTISLTTDGSVYAFGGNQFGQLGLGAGPDEAETSPKLLEAPLFENKNAITVSCGARHSTILTEDGSLFSWGWNKYGQLGLGDTVDRNIPSQVTVSEYLPRNIACGWWHTLLLAEPI